MTHRNNSSFLIPNSSFLISFSPFLPMPQGISSHLSLLSFFFLTFFTFSQAKRFFILLPIVSQIHPHLGRTSFSLKREICYFDFVLADGSR